MPTAGLDHLALAASLTPPSLFLAMLHLTPTPNLRSHGLQPRLARD
jgi:hypothetical protein